MKTIKEQIEVMQAYETGKCVDEIAHSDFVDKRRRLINKEFEPGHVFDWVNYDYEIFDRVMPLFPDSYQGAKFTVPCQGNVYEERGSSSNGVKRSAKQGRTFYTREDAEAFARREQAKVYCLEAINRVNDGDNGFKADNHNYHIDYKPHMNAIGVDSSATYLSLEPNEYIRTEKAAKELINDADFVENWKIWKGVE